MLLELHIRNFAIIEQQSISFKEGLNVISGETGAGKSIVLQALELILGGRPRSKLIRADTDGWELQALFSLDNLSDAVRSSLPEIVSGSELVVSRSMSVAGRGRVLINGQLGSVSMLEQITSKLINVCGQGHHVKLLDPGYHLSLVDGYGGHEKLLGKYQKQFRDWKTSASNLAQLEERRERNLLRQAELEYVVEELSAVEWTPTLRFDLEEKVRLAKAGEASLQKGGDTLALFDGTRGLFDLIQQARSAGKAVIEREEAAEEYVSHMLEGEAAFEAAERCLRQYLESITFDDESLAQCRDDLAEVARLERKFKTDCAGLASMFTQAQDELATIVGGVTFDSLREEVAQKKVVADKAAAQLTKARKKVAKTLVKLVKQELSELSMPDAELEPKIVASALSDRGAESLEFLIAPNRGQPARELRKIASGGELSRIMLVLKKILRDRSGVNVLVFDEVDSGISGMVARAVGEKLKALADGSQVLCITHLPQVASLADAHFLVAKKRSQNTISVVKELSNEERLQEVARMLSGFEITEAALESARELMVH